MPNYKEEIIYKAHFVDREGIESGEALRARGLGLARCMRELCPPSRELSIARTKLEEAVMWAGAAIARHKAYLEEIEKMAADSEAEVKEAERVAAVRAKHPNAKNQTIGR